LVFLKTLHPKKYGFGILNSGNYIEEDEAISSKEHDFKELQMTL